VSLLLEQLEERTVPTVVFDPQYAKESVSSAPYTVLNNATVYLIFWGTNFDSGETPGPTAVTKLTNDAKAIISSPYFAGLSEYGNIGTVTYGGAWTAAGSDPPADYNVGNGSSIGEDQSIISTAIANNPSWDPAKVAAPIYVVVPVGGSAGYNSQGTYNSTTINICSVGGASSTTDGSTVEDWFGQTFSHEVAERISDPASGGVGVSFSSDPSFPAYISYYAPHVNNNPGQAAQQAWFANSGQIGDGEQELGGDQHYGYKLNGVKVQSFWSASTPDSSGNLGAFIVPDGNSKAVYLQPVWGTTSVTLKPPSNAPPGSQPVTFDAPFFNAGNPFDLLITGTSNDSVTIDAGDGQTTVNLDGQNFVFSGLVDGGQIRNITVDCGGGSNFVSILNVAADQTVHVVGGGSDTVNIGANGSVQGIQGTVNIENPPSLTTIHVDDSADSTARTVTLSNIFSNPADSEGNSDPWGQISGLAPGTINYEYSHTQSLTISTGTAAGNVIDVQATDQTTNLISNGPTTINVGYFGSVQGIAGDLNIENPTTADDTISVDDSLDFVARTATLSTLGANSADSEVSMDPWGQISGLAPANINYEYGDTVSLTVRTGAMDGNVVNIQGTGTTTNVVGNANATVNVGSGGLVQGVQGNVNIENPTPAASTTVNVDDSADSIPRTVALQNIGSNPADSEGTSEPWGRIAGFSPANINYEYHDTASVTVQTGNAAGTIVNIQATGTTTSVVNHAAVTDNVGSADNSLDPIQGLLSVTGQGAGTTLNVHDESTSSTEFYNLSANGSVNQVLRYPYTVGQPLGSPTQTINYASLTNVNVYGGSAPDHFGVQSTTRGTSVAVFGGPSGKNLTGGNEFSVANASDTLDDIHGPVAVHGGSIFDFAYLYDGLNTIGHTYTLTASSWQRDDLADITYDGLGELILPTGDPHSGHTPISAVNVLSTAATTGTIIAVGGGDRVYVGEPAGNGSLSTLQGIQGELRVQSGTNQLESATVTLDDSADTQTGKQVVFDTDSTGWGVSGLAPSRIYLNLGVGSNVQVTGGSPPTGNTFTIQSVPVALSITGGAGNDHFVFTNTAPLGANVTLAGGGGTDTLRGPNIANTWKIAGTNAGNLDGDVTFTGIQSLLGGTANDSFQFQTGGSISGTLDGGGGTNTLDYSAYVGNILVDLLLGTATGVNGGATYSESNIQNVNGSHGNDLIVGDANANVLTGGTGRNVIIGDGGGNTITGGGGFNLLIGATTSYDGSLPALQALMLYWDNPAATTLDQLVNPLKSKTGVTVNGQVLIFNKTTVQTNNSADKLTGGSGPNWFIVDKDGDTITSGGSSGPTPNDRLLVI
jgi:hypothetical protein